MYAPSFPFKIPHATQLPSRRPPCTHAYCRRCAAIDAGIIGCRYDSFITRYATHIKVDTQRAAEATPPLRPLGRGGPASFLRHWLILLYTHITLMPAAITPLH